MLQNKGIMGIVHVLFRFQCDIDYISLFCTWTKSAIMVKRPWDTDVMQRIICVLQLKAKEALLSFKHCGAISPPPSPSRSQYSVETQEKFGSYLV